MESRIADYGMRIDQIDIALKKIAPQCQLWYKEYATLSDIHTLITLHHWPVGINWWGLFYDSLEEEARLERPDSDHGHFSIVSDIQLDRNEVVIADPYYEYNAKDRVFPIDLFEERWWDWDDVLDETTNTEIRINSKHLMFIVAPKAEVFPQDLKMELIDEKYLSRAVDKSKLLSRRF